MTSPYWCPPSRLCLLPSESLKMMCRLRTYLSLSAVKTSQNLPSDGATPTLRNGRVQLLSGHLDCFNGPRPAATSQKRPRKQRKVGLWNCLRAVRSDSPVLEGRPTVLHNIDHSKTRLRCDRFRSCAEKEQNMGGQWWLHDLQGKWGVRFFRSQEKYCLTSGCYLGTIVGCIIISSRITKVPLLWPKLPAGVFV